MISVKHRTCSGVLTDLWEYDPSRRAVVLVIAGDGYDVPVCTDAEAEQGSFVLTRLSEDVWCLAPSYCHREGHQWVARHATYPASLDSDGLPSHLVEVEEFIALTHAPPHVRKELERL